MNSSEIIKFSTDYYKKIESSEEVNYATSKLVLDDLLYAHCTAVSILEKIISSKADQKGKSNKKINDRLIQIAIFYQGISMVEKTIRYAQYNIAAALVRQEYEIICNINEIKNDTQRQGKAPNAKNGFTNFKKQYGALSKMTHVVGDDWIYLYTKFNTGDENKKNPISLCPVEDKDACIDLYGKHILFIVDIILELVELYENMYDENFLSDELWEMVIKVIDTLSEWGIVILQDN